MTMVTDRHLRESKQTAQPGYCNDFRGREFIEIPSENAKVNVPVWGVDAWERFT